MGLATLSPFCPGQDLHRGFLTGWSEWKLVLLSAALVLQGLVLFLMRAQSCADQSHDNCL